MDSWLGFFPPTPALNRWNQVYAPTSWWMFGVLFYSIVGRAMASAKQDIVGGSEHEDLALHVDGLIGPASAESVKLVKLARWKKTTEWLNSPFTFPRLSTHVCSMQTILSLMASAFEESRHRNTCSIIPWLLPATSPAASAVRRIAKLLCNEGDPHWHPVSHAWTDGIRNILAVTCYILLGGLVHRCIHCFDELPWVLGRLGVGTQPQISSRRKLSARY